MVISGRLIVHAPVQVDQGELDYKILGIATASALYKANPGIAEMADLEKARPGATAQVRVDIIGHARIKYVGKYQSCMFLIVG